MLAIIKNYLTQSSPVLNHLEKVGFALLSGLFSFLFLLFFQPFGVNNYNPEETVTLQFFLVMLTMGFVICVFLAFNEFVVMFFLRKHLAQIPFWLWAIWTIWWLAIGVFLFYNLMGGWHDFRLVSYLEFLGNVGVLSVIPFGSLLVYLRFRDLKNAHNNDHYYQHNFSNEDTLLVLIAENQKDRFTIPLKFLLFIESNDNYITIHHLLGEKTAKTLFRLSLKSVQEAKLHPSLVRCHRSYLINLAQIQNVQGNRNKLQVFLQYVHKPIPVSKHYAESILKLVGA